MKYEKLKYEKLFLVCQKKVGDTLNVGMCAPLLSSVHGLDE